MLSELKNILLLVLVVSLVAGVFGFFASHYPPGFAILVELLILFWGGYTIYCWATNKVIPIRGPAEISIEASPYLRFVGLIVGLFYIFIAVGAFIQTI